MRRRKSRNLVISRKWTLRVVGLLCVALATIMFFVPTLGFDPRPHVNFRGIGSVAALGLACFIIADFTSD